MKRAVMRSKGTQIKKNYFTMKVLVLMMFSVFFAMNAEAQVKAFPGAEGYGADATGGRGGTVYKVTNLNDTGAGSLRAAVQASGARIVIFEVSGTIALNSTLKISNDNITIAGQTAPGDGICLKNYTLTISANNVIIRYLRCRLGDDTQVEDDAMNGRNRSNIIIDHCSMSWSVDETGSFYDNTNFTLQWCILSESLYKSIHDKGNHGYGGIWGGKGASFHHNLLAHHTSRNPRFCGSRYSKEPENEKIDHRNNVIFNWGGNSCYAAEGGTYNIVNNYYRSGPATSSSVKDRIIGPNAQDPNASNQQPGGVWGTFYIDGNYIRGYSSTTADNWKGVDPHTGNAELPGGSIDNIKSLTEYDAPEVTTYSAEEAYEYVLADVGATLPKRDPVDARVVSEVISGKPTYGASYGAGKGIIDTPSDVGGYPVLNSTTAPVDTDNDGMPDTYEDDNSLDKSSAADGKVVAANGYTNVENYLNSLVEAKEFLVRPAMLEASEPDGMEVELTWNDLNDNEDGFIIQRSMRDGGMVEFSTIAADASSFTDNTITEYGRYYYKIKTYNAELETYFSDSLRVDIEKVIGIAGLTNSKLKLKVGPNPFSDVTVVKFNLNNTENVNLVLMDITGKVQNVLESNMLIPGEYQYKIDATQLNNGIYFLQLKTNESSSLVKLVVEK